MSRDNLKEIKGPGLGSVSRMFDKRPRSIQEPLERPGKFTEGVPLVKLIKRKLVTEPEIVMLNKMRSVAAEKFRRLKTLLANAENGGPQVIVITSAGPEEGKSLTSINLALAFAADIQGEVLLVDADMRRPTVEHWVSPPPSLGLSELLTGQAELEHTILELENSPLKILPAGSPPSDPVELLGSDRAGALVEALRSRFRRVIIDTPPSVPFTDADAVGTFADGVLVVVRAGQTRRASYVQAVECITSAPLLGAVLNDLTFNLADRDSYHGYETSYYDYYKRERKPKR
jgi:capsular exopolysaccharide synthesis family protein